MQQYGGRRPGGIVFVALGALVVGVGRLVQHYAYGDQGARDSSPMILFWGIALFGLVILGILAGSVIRRR
jgi:hypothetical protein